LTYPPKKIFLCDVSDSRNNLSISSYHLFSDLGLKQLERLSPIRIWAYWNSICKDNQVQGNPSIDKLKVIHDFNLHVRDSGPRNGRPVVLINGFPLSSESFTPQFAELEAAGYRVVAYGRRGFGQSDRPTSGLDYDTLAANLNNLLVNLDLREVAFAGFSMGGGEIARFVANHGEQRLQRIVFAAAVPSYLMQRADNPEGPLTEEKGRKKWNF